MFFSEISEIQKIAQKNGTAIFVVPRETEFLIPGAIVLAPEEKSVITIEQVREVTARLTTKQVADQFIIVRPAEKMNEEAANAFLKNLEEPHERVHFVLITDLPSMILPTILSRAAVYFLKRTVDFQEIKADEKVKNLAKKLMIAGAKDLVLVAEEITKKKEGVRAYALEVVGAAIEMLYKAYFLTSKEVFLAKIPKFLRAYEGISRNGHIKLQIVSNLC
ncbi:hypothetical protein IJJ49_00420 [Candidatus Saccharibacteria bacterium]|nr:hypothetical protein [Candidatus Saccharibacteria bacterium]